MNYPLSAQFLSELIYDKARVNFDTPNGTTYIGPGGQAWVLENFVEGRDSEGNLNGYQGGIFTGLSGGQKQRIAIARALLKRPKILIFDEATSSLDQATAEQFARTINQLKGKVTMLFIAHQIPKGLKVDEVVMLGPNESQMGVINGDKS